MAFGALQRLRRPARLVIVDSPDEIVAALRGIDSALNLLHGGAGEDGTVQLLLDVLGVAYPGSGAPACARAMDKPRAKAAFRQMGIPTPEGRTYDGIRLGSFVDQVERELGLPVVVKPPAAGSSIGISIIRSPDVLRPAIVETIERFSGALVEQYVDGRELTVGILRIDGEDRPLPVIEIRPSREFFDYEAKYHEGISEFLAPAPLEERIADAVQAVSLAAHRALGCTGFSRVDLRLGVDGVPYVLEVNTLPGMTPMSDLPRAAAAAGIPFDALVGRLLDMAEKEGTR